MRTNPTNRRRPLGPGLRSWCFLALVAVLRGENSRLPWPRDIHDGFEEPRLSALWRTDKLADGAIAIQPAIVHSGRSALRVTIHPGDKLSAAQSTGNRSTEANERDEIQEAKQLESREGEPWAYAFSLYVPKDFPIVPTRLVLAQWKHRNDRGTEVVNNPVLALRYEEGTLSISTQTDRKKVTRFKTKEDIRGRWVDLLFHIRFSRKEAGEVRAWMDGKPVLSFQGPTAYGEEQGYPVESDRFYFKMGLYRDTMPEPMTVFIDDYRKYPLSGAGRKMEEPIAPTPGAD